MYTGNDIIDPPLEFPIGEDVVAEFSRWSEISDMCGDSRLWGGMHFYVSHLRCISASESVTVYTS